MGAALMATATEIVARARICDLWVALGGGELRHGRGKGFWRDGDGWNIAINESKGVFYDHAHGEGGGVLDLVQTALGCDRKRALEWLAAHQGVNLDNRRPLTRHERRQYSLRRSRAELAARDFTRWWRDVLRRARAERNRLYLSENASSAVARTLLATGDGDENAWDDIWKHAHDDLRADAIDAEIQRLKTATPGELVAMRQKSHRAA